MNERGATLLSGSPYGSYVYAYPHKTAYRPLSPPRALEEVWASERRDALFLYMHIPFCEMRCGFCNLFTAARPKGSLVAEYLDALGRQCRRVREALPDARFARFAIGGGTPTYLELGEIAAVLDLAEGALGASLPGIPCSVEASPETAALDKLRLLRARGVDRISIGVQSFVEAEAAGVGRPQRTGEILGALDAIRSAGFPALNIDLMYGLPGQTEATWVASIEAALGFRPEELYLYPLYVRPLTGIGRKAVDWDDQRVSLYRLAVGLLRSAGYAQASMRMFRAAHAPAEDGPVYCVQEDGMVGLGCGARSYTSALHYATEYAVGARGVRDIIDAYLRRPEEDFGVADYGFALDGGEQRRRHVTLSLLAEGVDLAAYRRRFGSDALDDLPELGELLPLGLAAREGDRLALTPLGVERSDAIGPWLESAEVRSLRQGYAAR